MGLDLVDEFGSEQYGYFRNKLLTLQQELESLAEISKAAGDTVQLDQSCVGRLSRMDALQQQAMGQESERRRQLELVRIRSALTRIEEGEFGDCVRCGEPIARARLELSPAAPLCIRCAEAADG